MLRFCSRRFPFLRLAIAGGVPAAALVTLYLIDPARDHSSRSPSLFSRLNLRLCNGVRLDNGGSATIATDPLGWNDLHIAAANGDSERLKELLKLAESAKSVNAPDNWNFRLPNSSLQGIMEGIKERERLFPIISPTAMTKGATPLHYAVASGNQNAIEVLLDAGGDLSARDDKGRTPKDYAEEGWLVTWLEEKAKASELSRKKKEQELRVKCKRRPPQRFDFTIVMQSHWKKS